MMCVFFEFILLGFTEFFELKYFISLKKFQPLISSNIVSSSFRPFSHSETLFVCMLNLFTFYYIS